MDRMYRVFLRLAESGVKMAKRQKLHLYPAVLLIGFVVFTAMGLHGWSIGKLYDIFSSTSQGADPALVHGLPLDIRSDEWAVLTPKSFAQYENGLRKTNDNIGTGENEAIIVDAPTDDFSALFAPQNLGFHFLPLANAIAFKWQFLSLGLLVVTYYFALRFFTKKISIAIALSAIVLYAPLIQWTFRSFLIIPLMMGMIALLLADSMRQTGLKERRSLFLVPALAYTLFAFILPLYPPFQIGVALSLGVFYITWAIAKEKSLKKLLSSHAMVAIGVVLALGLTGLFYVQNQGAIRTIMSADFPGVRHFTTGRISNQFDFADLYASGTTRVANQDPTTSNMRSYYLATGTGNQSENASTVWVIPPLLITFAALLYMDWRSRERRILLVGVMALQLFVIFFLFVPGLEIPIISQIQPNRFSVVLLVVTLISLGILSQRLGSKDIRQVMVRHKKIFYGIVGVWALHTLLLLLALYKIRSGFEIINFEMMVLAVLAMGAFAYNILYKKTAVGYGILAILVFMCSYDVNPIYRGTDSIANLPIVQDIKTINAKSSGGWFFDGSYALEALPLIANVQTVTTNMSYEQSFWKYLDPTGKNKEVYDRSAHVMGEVSPESKPELVAVNQIKINLNPCDANLVRQLGIKYIVTVKGPKFSDYTSSCMKRIKTVHTKGLGDAMIYRVEEKK